MSTEVLNTTTEAPPPAVIISGMKELFIFILIILCF
jgi:hypothetical protein